MTKFIGLDVGTVRIGVAKADSDVRIAVPLKTVSVDGNEFEEIAKLARLANANIFVIGLPRNSKGEETAQSKYVREFAKKLKTKVPTAKICFEDESLTSVEAENRLKNKKHGYVKGDIDSEAATIILQDFLERLANNFFKVEDEQPKTPKKKIKKSRSLRRSLLNRPIVLVSIIAGSVAAIAVLIFTLWYNLNLAPVLSELKCEENSVLCTSREKFVIEPGETITTVAERLENKNVIKNQLAFRIYARVHGFAGEIKAGTYELLRTSSSRDIAAIITVSNNGAAVFRFTVLPGETVSNVNDRLLGLGYSNSEIRNALNGKAIEHPILATKPANATLEGYLYGDTYEFYVGVSIETIIKTMLDKLQEVVKENDLESKFAAHGLTLHEGIILASVVQKESKPGDQPTVAQILYSRLAKNDRLGCDATAKYAADQIDPYREIYTNNNLVLNIDSCYNTRRYPGMPCGAIASPGESALLAVANPTDTTYYYFLTGDDGKMYYSYTEKEHVENTKKYCQKLCNLSL